MNRDELFLTSRKKTVHGKKGGSEPGASEGGVFAGTATRVARPRPGEARVPAEAPPVSACSFYILYEAAPSSPRVTPPQHGAAEAAAGEIYPNRSDLEVERGNDAGVST